jgi:hypothetical protein
MLELLRGVEDEVMVGGRGRLDVALFCGDACKFDGNDGAEAVLFSNRGACRPVGCCRSGFCPFCIIGAVKVYDDTGGVEM